jgi:hypothetical protein
VLTDAAPIYPALLAELVSAAWHHVERYGTFAADTTNSLRTPHLPGELLSRSPRFHGDLIRSRSRLNARPTLPHRNGTGEHVGSEGHDHSWHEVTSWVVINFGSKS